MHYVTNFFKENLVFIFDLTVTINYVFLCFTKIYAFNMLAFARRFGQWLHVGDSTSVTVVVIKILLLQKKPGRPIVDSVVSSHIYL